MELDACIKGRRSIRDYSDEPVLKEQIEAILEAGTWAPHGMSNEPWKFIVIENKSLIKYISDEAKALALQIMPPPLAERFKTDKDVVCYDAPVLILICTEKSNSELMEHISLLDSVVAAQNMFVKAHELGLGTCYMGLVSGLNNRPEILRKIGVPDNCQMKVPFVLGCPKGKQGAGKREKPTISGWIK